MYLDLSNFHAATQTHSTQVMSSNMESTTLSCKLHQLRHALWLAESKFMCCIVAGQPLVAGWEAKCTRGAFAQQLMSCLDYWSGQVASSHGQWGVQLNAWCGFCARRCSVARRVSSSLGLQTAIGNKHQLFQSIICLVVLNT